MIRDPYIEYSADQGGFGGEIACCSISNYSSFRCSFHEAQNKTSKTVPNCLLLFVHCILRWYHLIAENIEGHGRVQIQMLLQLLLDYLYLCRLICTTCQFLR